MCGLSALVTCILACLEFYLVLNVEKTQGLPWRSSGKAFSVGGMALIPGRGNKIPYAAWPKELKKKKKRTQHVPTPNPWILMWHGEKGRVLLESCGALGNSLTAADLRLFIC